MSNPGRVVVAGDGPDADRAFASDPVLAARPREFSHRRTFFPVVLNALGVALFTALIAAVVVLLVRSWGEFGAEQLVLAAVAVFGALMVVTMTGKLLDRRTRSAWQEVRGDHVTSLASEWFAAGELPDVVHGDFESGTPVRFPALSVGRTSTGTSVGVHLYGDHYPLYITVWVSEGDDARVWPLVALRSSEARQWAESVAVGKLDG